MTNDLHALVGECSPLPTLALTEPCPRCHEPLTASLTSGDAMRRHRYVLGVLRATLADHAKRCKPITREPDPDGGYRPVTP